MRKLRLFFSVNSLRTLLLIRRQLIELVEVEISPQPHVDEGLLGGFFLLFRSLAVGDKAKSCPGMTAKLPMRGVKPFP